MVLCCQLGLNYDSDRKKFIDKGERAEQQIQKNRRAECTIHNRDALGWMKL